MNRQYLWSILGVMLLWPGAAAADPQDLNHRLRGDYAFTGEAACMESLVGFTAKLTPTADGVFLESFSVQGVRTFNGDGTGTLVGRSVGFTAPSSNPGAGSSDFQASFMYNVAPDGTFTSQLSGLLTGTVLTGDRAGQTFTLDLPPVSGIISADRESLTLAHDAPAVETITYSNGNVHYRICHRSRVLLRLKRADDD